MSIEFDANIGKEPPQGGSSSLSADEIRTAGGAIAADLEYLLTGGSANAYTATPSPAWTSYADGAVIYLEIHAASTTAANINVSGLGTVEIYKVSQSGSLVALTGTELPVGLRGKFVYDSGISKFVLASDHRLQAADIPSTLNATTFAGDITLPLGGGVMGPAGNAGYTYFCGGASEGQSNGAYISLSGVGWTGDAGYYCGNNAGAAHSFFDKNGAEQLRVDENGLNANYITPLSGVSLNNGTSHGLWGIHGNGGLHNHLSNAYSTGVWGASQSNGFSDGAGALYCGNSNFYPGAHQQFAPLTTRAASTAFAVCPVATGDVAIVEIMEDGATNGVLAFVTNGAVYLADLIPSYAKNAAYVLSSTPGAAEAGIYLSAGVLYIKPGSSWTAKIGSFSKIWKA